MLIPSTSWGGKNERKLILLPPKCMWYIRNRLSLNSHATSNVKQMHAKIRKKERRNFAVGQKTVYEIGSFWWMRESHHVSKYIMHKVSNLVLSEKTCWLSEMPVFFFWKASPSIQFNSIQIKYRYSHIHIQTLETE